jgi:hypothetical protein
MHKMSYEEYFEKYPTPELQYEKRYEVLHL